MKDISLTPLIIIFAVVILLTIVVLNSKIDTNKHEKPTIEDNNLNIRKERNISLSKPRNDVSFNYVHQLAKAKQLIKKGRVSESEETLCTILIFRPNDLDVLSLLGGIYYYSGKYKKAAYIFNRQILIDPKSPLAYNLLASTLEKQDKIPDAIEANKKAISIKNNLPEIHFNISGMYSIAGNKDEAFKHLNIAYESFGPAILPLMLDSAFNNIRSSVEFQLFIANAEQDKKYKLQNNDVNRP